MALQQARLGVDVSATAPDGSSVRFLLGLPGRGGFAHFELEPGQTSVAVAHRTIDEIWYIVAGRGQIWRRLGDEEAVVDLAPGVCIDIPKGTHFQFRAAASAPPLAALAATMPPWPGAGEAYRVEGPWPATVAPGPS